MLAIRALVHDIFDVRAALKLSLGRDRRTRAGKARGLPDAATDHAASFVMSRNCSRV